MYIWGSRGPLTILTLTTITSTYNLAALVGPIIFVIEAVTTPRLE